MKAPFVAAGLLLAATGLGSAAELKPAASFAAIADPRARATALFEEAGKVLQHPRCVNCHPADDRPRQGEQPRLHEPMAMRGPDGHGAPAMRCQTCHQAVNVDHAGVPGHPQWHLAPLSMAWLGRPLGEICAQIKDSARNGGKTLGQMVEHMAHDSLVGWAWRPGRGREPAPGSQAVFGELIRAWADNGAACPSG